MGHLGWLALDDGDLDAAQPLFEESLRLAHSVNAGSRVLTSLEGIGEIAAQHGNPARALRLFGAADALRESSGAAIGAPDRGRFENRLAHAVSMLPTQTSKTAYQAGRRLSLESAFQEALRQQALQ